MIPYFSIEHYSNKTKYPQFSPAYIFPKYDGNNFRAEFDFKKGFVKFGTRTHLSDLTEQYGIKAIPIITSYEKELADKLTDTFFKNKRITFFFEIFTENSFAGSHPDWSAPFFAKMIDVHVANYGFIKPSLFVEIGHNFDFFAKPVFVGTFNKDVVEKVKCGELGTFEGVVVKFDTPKFSPPVMFKIKNEKWYEKLAEVCHGDMKKFELLK